MEVLSFFTVENPTPTDHKQSRLIRYAAFFLLAYSIALSLAPAARLHRWEVDYRWNHWIGFLVWLIGTAVIHQMLMRVMPERDPYIFPIVALLTGWGLLTIWRLDSVMGLRQTFWLAICLALFGAGLRVPNLLDLLRRYKYLWLTAGLLLTLLTFILGTYPSGDGPRLWLGCCGIYFQPSELLKLLLIVYLSAYLADRLPISFSLMHLLTPTLILIGLALGMLIYQRDLGAASLYIIIYTVVIYLASRKRRILIISLTVLLAAGAIGYILFDVVRIRVDAWLNPWLDPTGRSYQIVQSLIAIASGGILGTGPGLGSPGIVPVTHSDFIFASLAEETGLVGVAGLLMLYALLVGRGFRTAIMAPNLYRRYLAAGITSFLVIQAILIISGNLRLLPLTGVTLPFVSYGGSSLLTSFMAVLLLIHISNRGEDEPMPAPLPDPKPYLLVSGALLCGLLVLGLATGWWATVRSDALTARADNPRRWVNDRYVRRGSLIDRTGMVINQTSGEPGSYSRVYQYPPLSATTGYNNPLYGQAGLEAGLDAYLRGLSGLDESVIRVNRLLYSQPPPGVDVRLTIDLRLQQEADKLLEGHKGALVLLNPDSGEILVMASHPYFEPNLLSEIWDELRQDSDAPLLNRATQGQYPPGAALGPFLLGYGYAIDALPQFSGQLNYTTGGETWTCARRPQAPVTVGDMVASGCPAPLVALSREINSQAGANALGDLLASLGFFSAPEIPVSVASPSQPENLQPAETVLGQGNLAVSPLQMALAAAALSNQGFMPAPDLVIEVAPAEPGSVDMPAGQSRETLLAGGVQEALEALTVEGQTIWQAAALARSNETDFTWFLAGTTPDHTGTPATLALVLEENNPELAEQIGQSVLSLIDQE
ncbi:MAG: FtsW/RodA/SpoVE family cell cycle protein [Chloroflexi bacterium]|nr:FtsW/RodA/SpoVE family cell cycle protein [Chloroflexota bacterium]